MFEIFQYILMFLGLAIAAILIYAATKPAHGRTARSVEIKAPPERIFPLIDNLKQMNTWNPFVKTDPNLKGVYSGPASGKGAAYAFDGNKNAGAGHITITDSVPSSKVTMNLVMTRPFACDNIVEFTLVPNGSTTIVTWAMSGPAPYFMRVMGTLFNMEKMMHGTFDKGLADLKAMAEH
jgi:uncharacterized protein YndB with AHSA1/START domain